MTTVFKGYFKGYYNQIVIIKFSNLILMIILH